MRTTIRSLQDLRDLVRSERKRRGLTQSQAAALIGRTQKWLSDLESGRSNPPTSMMLEILALLAVSLVAETVDIKSRPSDLAPDEREIDIDEGL
jgi:transcriptional regulator with XRE-family HTH domain